MLSKQFTYEELEQKIKELTIEREQLLRERSVAEARRVPSELTRNIRDVFTIQKDIDVKEKEIENLNLQLLATPKIIYCGKIRGEIIGRWSYSFGKFTIKLSQENKWFVPLTQEIDNRGKLKVVNEDAPYQTEIICNEDNIPIKLRRFLRNSDTRGYLFCYEYDVELDIYPNENICIKPKQIQEIKRCSKVDEGMSMINQPIDTSILELAITIDEQMKEYTCKCGYKIHLGIFLRNLRCPSCTAPLDKQEVIKLLNRKEVKK